MKESLDWFQVAIVAFASIGVVHVVEVLWRWARTEIREWRARRAYQRTLAHRVAPQSFAGGKTHVAPHSCLGTGTISDGCLYCGLAMDDPIHNSSDVPPGALADIGRRLFGR